jgi:hypothetical protein
MYELMVDYWPTAETDPSAIPAMREFARIWKDKPKIVFSRTLERVDWNSRLVRADAAAEVARLKAQPGFDIDVGGPTTASTLMRAGLIDEYRPSSIRWSRGPARRSSRRWTIGLRWSLLKRGLSAPAWSISGTRSSAGLDERQTEGDSPSSLTVRRIIDCPCYTRGPDPDHYDDADAPAVDRPTRPPPSMGAGEDVGPVERDP